jgi:hypothetical protein
VSGSQNGTNGNTYGGGAGGAIRISAGAPAGGAGADGVVILTYTADLSRCDFYLIN